CARGGLRDAMDYW
nr:immunoglobulin heavy chain junction region [Mus musculus]